MGESAIRIEHLMKEYPLPKQKEKRIAVNDLSLEVSVGDLFGFLGPNGAGKTTTIKTLLGFIPPTSGKAWLFDIPVDDDRARRRVGYLPEQPYFPKFLSAQEVVRTHAGLAGLSGTRAVTRADAALREVGMYENRHHTLSKCSKGMVQRVGLASALVGDPDLLIMDEPSSGLDPVGRKELRELLVNLKQCGKTIFLSSHLLSEMEPLCDRIGIVSRGKLVALGAPNEITRSEDETVVEIGQAEIDSTLAVQIAEMGGTHELPPAGANAKIHVPNRFIYSILDVLNKRHAKLVAVTPKRESLEDAFLRLVG